MGIILTSLGSWEDTRQMLGTVLGRGERLHTSKLAKITLTFGKYYIEFYHPYSQLKSR